MTLAEALLRARQTVLTNLVLKNVGMGDKGIAAVASLVSQGHMNKLKVLNITKNKALTHQGFVYLARAIDARGLPMLETFRMQKILNVTLGSMCAITHALIKGCPRLKEIDFTDTGTWGTHGSRSYPGAIQGMLEAAGRVEDVDVIYEREDGSMRDAETDEDI